MTTVRELRYDLRPDQGGLWLTAVETTDTGTDSAAVWLDAAGMATVAARLIALAAVMTGDPALAASVLNDARTIAGDLLAGTER